MAKNDFTAQRTAYGQFTLGNTASTHTSGCYIPAGAVITNIRVVAPGAVTLTGASGTVYPRVSSVALAATKNISTLCAQTAIVDYTITAPVIAVAGELQLVEGASSNAAATAVIDVYVDYLYVT